MTFSFRDAERRLWLEGAEAFRDLLHDDAVMTLAMPGPVMSGDAIHDSIRDLPRWDDVTFRSVREADHIATHVFAYEAEGRRDGQNLYRAACLSVWANGDDGWRLIAHSQLPGDATGERHDA
ncbi:MAG: nuclear transport factor 2 family protein [Silicimonas sp.]|nr:nuclear transport factor 2 family protein [Silicimonas sp.]RZW06639.1 MAG: nuclear transport factor 2 family protein [Paracoccaceae bacterium]NND20780.1 nuclear transport factor 2 family protein [Silicimonas sp.]NND43608.1 nuclear transport factor 2 family protein [Silicimonas sp.]NNL34565.1 nuclear transport factor 2 family protein [Silicimonas sp.]